MCFTYEMEDSHVKINFTYEIFIPHIKLKHTYEIIFSIFTFYRHLYLSILKKPFNISNYY